MQPNEPNTSAINYPGIPANTETVPAIDTSLLGTPVYEIIQFRDGSEVYKLPYTALIDVTQKKKITKTSITGVNGSVKEFIQLEDFDITIRGFIIGRNQYPADAVRELQKWWLKNRELEVISPVLNGVFGIYHIVIEEADFPRVEGKPGVQPFRLSCVSDIPIELQLRDNNVTIN